MQPAREDKASKYPAVVFIDDREFKTEVPHDTSGTARE